MYFINNIKFKIRNSFYFQCLINKFDYTFHEKYYEITGKKPKPKPKEGNE